jgi:hypothetical protein
MEEEPQRCYLKGEVESGNLDFGEEKNARCRACDGLGNLVVNGEHEKCECYETFASMGRTTRMLEGFGRYRADQRITQSN